MNSFTWIEPRDLDAALAAGAEEGSIFKAGGVDVADRLKEHVDEPRQLVNIGRLKQLEFIKLEGGMLRLGPLVTLAALAEDARVSRSAPALDGTIPCLIALLSVVSSVSVVVAQRAFCSLGRPSRNQP